MTTPNPHPHPTPSPPTSPKTPTLPHSHLKNLTHQVSVAKNRVATLKAQLRKQLDSIRKNKQLTQQVIAKKMAVHEINSYKNKDNSESIARVEGLRRRNLEARLEHERSIENIYKAIYLVKLDDAREVKNISKEHRRKLEESQREGESIKRQKKQKFKKQSQQAKKRYLQYWKQKLSSIYMQQAQSAQQILKLKQQKQIQLKHLQQQELKLLEQINMYHGRNVEAKKEYVAALSLPVREVVEAVMGGSGGSGSGSGGLLEGEGKGRIDRQAVSMGEIQTKSLNKHKIYNSYGSSYGLNMSTGPKQQDISTSMPSPNPNPSPKLKVPNAKVDHQKLKIILQELKRIDRNKQRYQEDGGGQGGR